MQFPIKLILLFFSAHSMLFGKQWNTVYLASFPRSGNHWVRFLVEEATHIATSSIYRDNDYPHLEKKFPWDAYCTDHGYEGHCRYPTNDDPVLVKTHYPVFLRTIKPNPKYAICLIRHPVDAFWSYNIYSSKNKTTQINKQMLTEFIHKWRMFYEFWTNQPGVLFIRYEDLLSNTAFNLSLILQRAGFSFNQTDIERAVTKYSPKEKPLKHMNHYDAESIEMIKTELTDILIKFGYDL